MNINENQDIYKLASKRSISHKSDGNKVLNLQETGLNEPFMSRRLSSGRSGKSILRNQ